MSTQAQTEFLKEVREAERFAKVSWLRNVASAFSGPKMAIRLHEKTARALREQGNLKDAEVLESAIGRYKLTGDESVFDGLKSVRGVRMSIGGGVQRFANLEQQITR